MRGLIGHARLHHPDAANVGPGPTGLVTRRAAMPDALITVGAA